MPDSAETILAMHALGRAIVYPAPGPDGRGLPVRLFTAPALEVMLLLVDEAVTRGVDIPVPARPGWEDVDLRDWPLNIGANLADVARALNLRPTINADGLLRFADPNAEESTDG